MKSCVCGFREFAIVFRVILAVKDLRDQHPTHASLTSDTVEVNTAG